MQVFPSRMLDSGERICKKSYDQKIVDGILKNSNHTIADIYSQNFVQIKKMVWSFRNTTLDPEDVFQEGLTRAIINIRDGRFRGDSSFSTYLNSICRNICRKQLSQNRAVELNLNTEAAKEENHFEILDKLLQLKKKLDDKCIRIIDLRFALEEAEDNENPGKSLSFDEIANQLQLSAANARQRFKRCLDKLRKQVSRSELNDYFLG